jgi:hypothetical protein
VREEGKCVKSEDDSMDKLPQICPICLPLGKFAQSFLLMPTSATGR